MERKGRKTGTAAERGISPGMDGSSLMNLAARIQESTAGQEETQETPEEEERAGEDAQTVWQAADFEIPSSFWPPWQAGYSGAGGAEET